MPIETLASPAIENCRRKDNDVRPLDLDRASQPIRYQDDDRREMRSAAQLAWGRSVRELVKELASVHHSSLRTRLLGMESMFDRALSGTANSLGAAVGQKLSLLHGEVVYSLLRAEHVAFPLILELADAAESALSSMPCLQHKIRRAACSLEAQHATALQAIWGLLRLADRMDDANSSAGMHAFWSALTEFSGEFYTYLHKLHSVLFQLVVHDPNAEQKTVLVYRHAK